MYLFGLDLIHHTLLAGLLVRIVICAEILLRHFVEVEIGILLECLHRVSPNFQIAIGIIGVNDYQRNSSVATDIFVLVAALCGIEKHKFVFDIAPNRCDSGRTVVPRLAKARLLNRSRYSAGIVCDMRVSFIAIVKTHDEKLHHCTKLAQSPKGFSR
jgi:hypothetical protein